VFDDILKDFQDEKTRPGEGIVTTEYVPFDGLPTGSINLDYAIGNGKGLPRGQVTLLSGDEGSGKTSILLLVGAKTVQEGGKVAVLNYENRWNVEYAWRSGMGMPGKNYFLMTPYSQEDGLNIIVDLAHKGFDLCMVDSAAAMPPRAELEGELEDAAMMLQSRVFSKFFRMRMSDIALSTMAVIFTAQHRLSPSQYEPVTVTGGKALKYFSSVHIRMNKPTGDDWEFKASEEDKKSKEKKPKFDPIGLKITGKTGKNTIAPPMREISLNVRFSPGLHVNKPAEIADYGRQFRVLTKEDGGPIAGAAHWYYNGVLLGRKREEALVAIGNDKDLQVELERKILDVMKGS
jgi:recombination protein RecA